MIQPKFTEEDRGQVRMFMENWHNSYSQSYLRGQEQRKIIMIAMEQILARVYDSGFKASQPTQDTGETRPCHRSFNHLPHLHMQGRNPYYCDGG